MPNMMLVQPAPTGRRVLAGGLSLALGLGLAATTVAPPAAAATATVTIADPGSPGAGIVELQGAVGVGASETTTVLFVLDATNSTASPTGADCNGNGSAADDDLNADGSVGDVLDCEIAAVLALNGSLASSSGNLAVGLVGFADEAAAADLDPGAGVANFVAPSFTGGDAQPRINTVTRSVTRHQVGLYTASGLGGSGSGTAFTNAVRVALATLAGAPAGPKWIMFLSDGQSPIEDSQLTALSQSGARLRSFGIGADASCNSFGSLYKMASATGESCTLVVNPAQLSAGLTGTQPDSINGVTVAIGNVSVAAQVDPVGGWTAAFSLGAGTYTATATAVLVSGTQATAQRTFTVSAGSPGGGSAAPPPPSTVGVAPSSLKATAVRVARPKPMRAALPSVVTGVVGRPGARFTTTVRLAGSRVLLEARARSGDSWTRVDRDRVNRKGEFRLEWKRLARYRQLRVELLPYKSFAGSAGTVRPAKISACKVTKSGGRWSVACSTTARAGSKVRLLKGADVVDRARVRSGRFTLQATGKVSRHRVVVVFPKRRIGLDL